MKLVQFEEGGMVGRGAADMSSQRRRSADRALRLGACTADGTSVVVIDDLVEAAVVRSERLGALQARRIPVAVSGMMRWLQLDADTRRSVAAAIKERLATATLSGGASTSSAPAGQQTSFTTATAPASTAASTSSIAATASTPVIAVPLSSLQLRAPIGRPGKIVGIGRNYADHAKETGVAPFEKPRIIFKMPSSVSDPGATVARPASVTKLDFEAELAVVIGEFARDVPLERALDVVAGYTVLNDVSAREFQFDVSPAQTTFAKSMDGFCPLGPCLVTADEIPDPQALRVQCWVNDEPMQDASTADMLFGVRELVSYISRFMTLEPGDLIATGTPAGIGAFRTPPRWLQPGDRVRAAVSGIGSLDTLIG